MYVRRIVALALLIPQLAAAQQAQVTLRATVTGNQEQPRVMYIVPWQPPTNGAFEYAPHKGLATDLFQRIERREFARDLAYRELLDEPLGTTDTNTEEH
jgi:hypothetical protein